MKATTTLDVPKNLSIKLEIEMTVEEMDALLAVIGAQTQWPMRSFRDVLRESLGKARAAYSSTWQHEGIS
jgi:hypothetical protein